MARRGRFLADRRGASAVEFALMAPLLVVLVMGVAELGRYGMFRMKLGNAAGNVADLVSRLQIAQASEIDAILATAPTVLAPFDDPDQLRVVVSLVAWEAPDEAVRVVWQRDFGALTAASAVGTPGQVAQVPDDLVGAGAPTLVVAEIMVRYDAWLLEYVVGHTAEEAAFMRPRRTDLTTLR